MTHEGHKDLFDLTGRNLVLTGGLGLLGLNYVKALSSRGAIVNIIDIVDTTEALSRIRKEVPAGAQENVRYFQGSVTDQEALTHIRDEITKHSGVIHGFIHNAARNPKVEGPQRTPTSFDLTEWREGLDVDATGAMLCAHIFKQKMVSGSSLVLVSSTYGVVGPDQRIYPEGFIKPAYYSAGKGAIISLTRYLAALWGSEGIRVNCLVLGGVENNQIPSFQKKYTERTPLLRMARPDEYNGPLIFLLSDASSYATGALFTIDGGFTAW